MCGLPHHQLPSYLGKLLKEAGLRVAIAEQLDTPAVVKGMVNREVVRVVTPATSVKTRTSSWSPRRTVIWPPSCRFPGRAEAARVGRGGPGHVHRRVPPHRGGKGRERPPAGQQGAFPRLSPKGSPAPQVLLPFPRRWNGATTPVEGAPPFLKAQRPAPPPPGAGRPEPRGASASRVTAPCPPPGPCSLTWRAQPTPGPGRRPGPQGLPPRFLFGVGRFGRQPPGPPCRRRSRGPRVLSSLWEVLGPQFPARPWAGANSRPGSPLRPLRDLAAIKERQDRLQFLLERGTQRRALAELLRDCADVERISSRLSAGSVTGRDLSALRRTAPPFARGGETLLRQRGFGPRRFAPQPAHGRSLRSR